MAGLDKAGQIYAGTETEDSLKPWKMDGLFAKASLMINPTIGP
jgi:hypothetical protein